MLIQDRIEKIPVYVLRWGRIIGQDTSLAAFGDER